MGNIQSQTPIEKNKRLLVERILVANCEYLQSEDNNILIGVTGIAKDEANPLANQAIRIGNSDLYKLINFKEGLTSVTYEFEKDVSLNIMRSDKKLIYNIKTPELQITREIDPLLVKFYKPIGMASAELDRIEKIYRLD
jgi:hypothetical protein